MAHLILVNQNSLEYDSLYTYLIHTKSTSDVLTHMTNPLDHLSEYQQAIIDEYIRSIPLPAEPDTSENREIEDDLETTKKILLPVIICFYLQPQLWHGIGNQDRKIDSEKPRINKLRLLLEKHAIFKSITQTEHISESADTVYEATFTTPLAPETIAFLESLIVQYACAVIVKTPYKR